MNRKIKITSLVTSGIIITGVVFSLYYSSNASREIPKLSCSYNSKFQQCANANQNGSPRWISEFVCPATQSYEIMLDQIILDEKFKEIQEKWLSYLESLEKDVSAIWDEPDKVIDDIINNFGPEWVYYKEYKKLCNIGILKERESCGWPIPIIPAWNRIADWSLEWECMGLAKIHLNIYSLVAFDLAKINKSQLISDAHKKYIQKEREKYNQILTTMWQIMWHTERINPEHIISNPK